MSEPLLTIAIPTFNRPASLRRTLERLLPQRSARWRLRIHDNCSSQPVAEAQRDLLEAFGSDVTLVRNAANLGASANVLRCFEQSTTPWLVVLGDDDEPAADFAAKVLRVIEAEPDAIFGTFSSSIFARAADRTTEGLAGFIHAIDDWSNVLFLSCCVYHRERLMPLLRFGYLYAYALAPHTAMLLAYLREKGGRCLFRHEHLVANTRDENGSTWSRVHISNTALILELLPTRELQQALFARMVPTFLPLPALAMRLAERAADTGEDGTLLFRFRGLAATCLAAPLRSALARGVLGFLVARPQLAIRLAETLRRLRGRPRVHATEVDLHGGL